MELHKHHLALLQDHFSNFAVQLKPENLAYHGQDPLLTLQLKCYYKGLLAKCVLHSIVVQI